MELAVASAFTLEDTSLWIGDFGTTTHTYDTLFTGKTKATAFPNLEGTLQVWVFKNHRIIKLVFIWSSLCWSYERLVYRMLTDPMYSAYFISLPCMATLLSPLCQRWKAKTQKLMAQWKSSIYQFHSFFSHAIWCVLHAGSQWILPQKLRGRDTCKFVQNPLTHMWQT